MWITSLVLFVIWRVAPAVVSREPYDFTCTVDQPGFHILGKSDCGVLVWKDSKRGNPLLIDYNKGGECKFQDFTSQPVTKDIWKVIGIKKREDYQPKPAFFSSQGERLSDSQRLGSVLMSGEAVFLIEGGQFQWPPVEVGFRMAIDGIEVGGDPVELETLAVLPPIFRVHNLASRAETDALIEHSKPHFVKADVVYMDKDKGKDVNEFRTSLNYRPRPNATPLLASMEARAASATRMPSSHQEPIQVLYYDSGGFYHAHDDAGQLQHYIGDKMALQRKHYGYFDRMLTLFWYMNDVPEGGETNFPRAGGPGGQGLPIPPSMRKCTQGLMVQPIAGQAVLWYNMYAHGLQTPMALHAACAVGKGVKYAINIWIYNKPMNSPMAEWQPEHPRVKVLERLAGKKAGSSSSANLDANDKGRSIFIVNKGEVDIQVYWKGNGGLTPMLEVLKPGSSGSLNTFVGHTFVAKSGNVEIATHRVTASGPKQQTFEVRGRRADL